MFLTQQLYDFILSIHDINWKKIHFISIEGWENQRTSTLCFQNKSSAGNPIGLPSQA